MAEPSFATVEDLEARMGSIPDATRAGAALADASSIIHLVSHRAWLDDDGAMVEDVPGVCVAICCSAARRVLDNPQGLTSQQVANYQATYANPTADVYLTKSEMNRIRQAAGISGSVGSIELESPHPLHSNRGRYATVYGQDEPIDVGPGGW